jgi:hypothetical protein
MGDWDVQGKNSDTITRCLDVLMYEYISHMLVEHNFLPLALKLLGQQDAVALCKANNEIEQYW